MQTAIVFVQLGKNPSPSLSSMAHSAKGANSNSQIYLISDLPSIWKEFPGEIIAYERIHRDEFVSKFIRKYPELYSIAGGYWLYTLERLFALKRIYEVIPSNSSFLHLESDVLSLLNSADFELLTLKMQNIACPRFSENRGIASAFFVPNQGILEKTLNIFTQILNEPKAPKNDMDLLGICLNGGIIDELPSLPKDAWENSQGEKLVFDGAAYGQYLFGQDPFHTEGKRISGFQNPYFGLNLQETTWEILESDNQLASSLIYSYHGLKYRVLNLHIHSKLILSPPKRDSIEWAVALSEANQEISRIADDYQANHIHTSKISLLNRFRLARRKGIINALHDAIMRRVQLLIKRYGK